MKWQEIGIIELVFEAADRKPCTFKLLFWSYKAGVVILYISFKVLYCRPEVCAYAFLNIPGFIIGKEIKTSGKDGKAIVVCADNGCPVTIIDEWPVCGCLESLARGVFATAKLN